jgi:enoyl-CoA hydratase
MSGTIYIENPTPHVRVLILDNPPMNPLGAAMRETFLAVLDEIEAASALRCLVIMGKGRGFCTGADLTSVDKEDLSTFGLLLDRLEASRIPVVAAVNGWCAGGGVELALCCDIRIASTEAGFICAGVNMGMMASAYRLPRLIGEGPAKSMLLTGLRTDAETALRFGLVTALHPPEELKGAAVALAERIASRAPLSVEATKRVASRAVDMTPQEAGRMTNAEMKVLRASADHREAVAAFRERREPIFTRS